MLLIVMVIVIVKKKKERGVFRYSGAAMTVRHLISPSFFPFSIFLFHLFLVIISSCSSNDDSTRATREGRATDYTYVNFCQIYTRKGFHYVITRLCT